MLACFTRHHRDDPALGQPLCPDCYDHAGHVVWNNTAGELRRRTATIGLHADATGTHAERLIHACWKLGTHPDYTSLQRWAHMLGFGGHFLTKR